MKLLKPRETELTDPGNPVSIQMLTPPAAPTAFPAEFLLERPWESSILCPHGRGCVGILRYAFNSNILNVYIYLHKWN